MLERSTDFHFVLAIAWDEPTDSESGVVVRSYQRLTLPSEQGYPTDQKALNKFANSYLAAFNVGHARRYPRAKILGMFLESADKTYIATNRLAVEHQLRDDAYIWVR